MWEGWYELTSTKDIEILPILRSMQLVCNMAITDIILERNALRLVTDINPDNSVLSPSGNVVEEARSE